MRSACGAESGIATIVAISPSALGVGGTTAVMPSVRWSAAWSFARSPSVPVSPFVVSTAISSGPFDPGPNASLSWS